MTQRALAALFRGAVSKDIVSRVWRKIKSDWYSCSARSLAARSPAVLRRTRERQLLRLIAHLIFVPS